MALSQANQSTEQQSMHVKTGAAWSNGVTPLSTRPTITPRPPATIVTHLHGSHYEPTPSLPSPSTHHKVMGPSWFIPWPYVLRRLALVTAVRHH